MPTDRAALGAFLRSRRDRLTPAQAGITPFPGARRVAGLRKEELAVLAGLSPDYYSRLEQGRQRNISDEILDALSRALRLDDTERAHLRDLAAPTRRRRPTTGEAEQRPDPGLLRLLDTLDHVPVLLLGRRGTVLARNRLLQAVLVHPMEPGSSFVHFLLLDPHARSLIINWEQFASTTVAALRREAGRRPDDGRLRSLIDELRSSDSDVARWWDDHTVRDYASVTKRIAHPSAGTLHFDIEMVSAPHEPDQHLVVYTVQAESPTARLLPILASWTSPAHSPDPGRVARELPGAG